jgi:hypothetical protein
MFQDYDESRFADDQAGAPRQAISHSTEAFFRQ